MTTYARQSALMRRLGFRLQPRDEMHKCPLTGYSYWEHQPSGAIVLIDKTKRCSAAKAVRYAIASAIGKRLIALEQTIARPIVQMRRDNEDSLDKPRRLMGANGEL